MKKICILICLCMLVSLLGACNGSKDPEVSVSVADPTTETLLPEESSTEPEVPVISLEEQFELIAKDRSNWLPEEEWYYDVYSYVITDLNRNGRVELLVSSCQGTGIYTMTDVYEVSEDGTQLVRFRNSMGEGASQADIIVGETPVYYNEETGIYTYVFSDTMRSGWEWNGVEYHAVYLTEDTVMEWIVAGASYEWDSEENCTDTYYNHVGEDIDEAAFNTAVADYFAGETEMTATFAWQNYNYDEASAMDTEDWVRFFEASYEGFNVS